MKIWFTSDLHLGHGGVIDYCNRPWREVWQMDEAIIAKFNAKVGHEDLVYFLGDISFHPPRVGLPLIRRLHGKRILIQGNHDKYSDSQYKEAGFEAVLQEAKIRLFGISFKLSHYPYYPDGEIDPMQLRYAERRPKSQGDWLLCGHVHQHWKTMGKQINVGVDVWHFEPVSISSLEKIVANSGRSN